MTESQVNECEWDRIWVVVEILNEVVMLDSSSSSHSQFGGIDEYLSTSVEAKKKRKIHHHTRQAAIPIMMVKSPLFSRLPILPRSA